ncbi:hypothetical protein VCHA53O473_40280 [Vibrio chagasii]|nr:hypothetical protein VCHA43P275_50277 [Vibrio chagasii]CAH7362308.1 hypothetical protein VCHA53O473_40280 [Vibrio chagasii]
MSFSLPFSLHENLDFSSTGRKTMHDFFSDILFAQQLTKRIPEASNDSTNRFQAHFRVD